ncbi:MAG TPA: O-antigen ligase family protein [Methylomirabilota bacterium]
MTAVLATLRGTLPTERLDHARVVAALLFVLAAGLAFSITLSETTLVVLALVLVVGVSSDAVRRAPLIAPVAAFAGWTVVTAALSAEPADSLRATKTLLPLATMWVVLAALPSSVAARRFATALFVAVTAAALSSIVQVVTCPADGGYGAGPSIPVVGGFFRKCARAHAFFSIYMTLAGVLTVVLTLTLTRLRTVTRPLLATAAWLIGAVALGLTLVRGAWLGFVVGAGLMLSLMRRRLLAVAVLVVLVAAALAMPTVHRRIETIGDPADDTTRDRVAMLRGGLRLIREHPLAGVGPGQVKRLYPVYAPPEALRRHTSHLHNTPLQIAVERGLVGLALWLWIFLAFFVRAGRVLRRVPPAAVADRALVVGALAAVAAFLVSGLFEYNFGDTEVLLVTLAVMALPFVVERELESRAA